MFNLLCGLFSGGGGNQCNQCAANICFQAIDPNDCPICGAVYNLTCACGKYITAITGRNGCVTFCGVCPGTYTLTQELAPFGFLPDRPLEPHKVVVNKRCCVKIDGLPIRCFQSINERDTTPQMQSDALREEYITTVTPDTDTIQGSEASPGCKIKAEFPGGCCCCTCVRRNGTWSMDVPDSETLQEGNAVILTQCCPCLLPSEPLHLPVVST